MDPKLEDSEADIVFLSNTYSYIENRTEYFSALKQSIAAGGALMVVDYKKKNLPLGLPQSVKVALSKVERERKEAGYKRKYSDDQTLPYQYIVIALESEGKSSLNQRPAGDTVSEQ